MRRTSEDAWSFNAVLHLLPGELLCGCGLCTGCLPLHTLRLQLRRPQRHAGGKVLHGAHSMDQRNDCGVPERHACRRSGRSESSAQHAYCPSLRLGEAASTASVFHSHGPGLSYPIVSDSSDSIIHEASACCSGCHASCFARQQYQKIRVLL